MNFIRYKYEFFDAVVYHFFLVNFQVNFSNTFSDCFFLAILYRNVFPKSCLRPRIFYPNRDFTVIWERSENQIGRPKKRSTKCLTIF